MKKVIGKNKIGNMPKEIEIYLLYSRAHTGNFSVNFSNITLVML
jgi:hypothetical protein